jgi:hypothetical protein
MHLLGRRRPPRVCVDLGLARWGGDLPEATVMGARVLVAGCPVVNGQSGPWWARPGSGPFWMCLLVTCLSGDLQNFQVFGTSAS